MSWGCRRGRGRSAWRRRRARGGWRRGRWVQSRRRSGRRAGWGGSAHADLPPSRLRGRRQFVHMLQEERQGPNLLVIQGVLPGRHARPAKPMLDLPEGDALGIIFDAVLSELRRPRILAQSDRARFGHAWSSAMAGGAATVEMDSLDQIGGRQRNRIGPLRRLARQSRMEGSLGHPCLQRQGASVGRRGNEPCSKNQIGCDRQNHDGHDDARYEASHPPPHCLKKEKEEP